MASKLADQTKARDENEAFLAKDPENATLKGNKATVEANIAQITAAITDGTSHLTVVQGKRNETEANLKKFKADIEKSLPLAEKAYEDLTSAIAAMEAKKADVDKVIAESTPAWEKDPEDEKIKAHKAQAMEQLEKVT